MTLTDEEFAKLAKAQGGDHLDFGVDDLVTLEDVGSANRARPFAPARLP